MSADYWLAATMLLGLSELSRLGNRGTSERKPLYSEEPEDIKYMRRTGLEKREKEFFDRFEATKEETIEIVRKIIAVCCDKEVYPSMRKEMDEMAEKYYLKRIWKKGNATDEKLENHKRLISLFKWWFHAKQGKVPNREVTDYNDDNEIVAMDFYGIAPRAYTYGSSKSLIRDSIGIWEREQFLKDLDWEFRKQGLPRMKCIRDCHDRVMGGFWNATIGMLPHRILKCYEGRWKNPEYVENRFKHILNPQY